MRTGNIMIRLTFTILIFGFMPACLKAQVHQHVLQIPFTKTAPVLDGKLDDAAWESSIELSEFVNWSLDGYCNDAVSVFLSYDEKNLYVAFRNSDPIASELNKIVNPKGPKDTFLWGRNHALVGIEYKGVYLQLMADPKGTMADWKDNEITWNGNWQYAAFINQGDWTAEFTIPLSEFGLNGPPENENLSLSLSRSYPAGESANWSGKCSLSGNSSVNCQYGKWPEPVPGENQLTFQAHNSGKKSMSLQCDLELVPLKDKPEFINQRGQGPSSNVQLSVYREPFLVTSKFEIPAGGSINQNIAFELPLEGSYFASVTVKNQDGTVLRRSRDYWFTIEPNRKKIQGLKERLGESLASMTRVSNPVAGKLREKAEELLAEIQELEGYADTAWELGKWNELTEQVEKADLQIAQHLHEVRWTAFHNWESEDAFGIAFTHSVIKLRKDALFPQAITDQVNLSLARNEYESFQLAILPFGRDMKQLSLEVSDLTAPDGSILSKDNIELALVDYNYIDWQAQYVTKYKGWHPDPLIPYSTPVHIEGSDVCRPVWITVYAPPGTKPGEYMGSVSLSASGMKKITATIRCHVWDFDLPVESHLKTHSWDEIQNYSDFYNLEEFPVEWYLRTCDLLLKNRFNPGSAGVNYVGQEPDSSGEYDFSKVEKVLEFCMERGLTRFSIMQMKKGLYTPEEAEQVYKFAEAYAKFLREKGWLDKALIELWDEPTDLEWPYIKERAERLKKIDPDLRLQLFAEGGPYNFWEKETEQYGLNKLIDMWAPINIIESPETQSQGGEIWAYYATLARENSPNLYIDCPAVYQRIIPWYSWMYGLDCFEHWGSNYFWRNVKAGKPMDQKWPNVPWDSRTYYYFNGEGQLVYPGPDGMPYSSVRLENFRDGMDDYEYLFKLKELIAEHETDMSGTELNEYRQLLNPQDYLLYKYPREIKVRLENTLRYPDQPERILETRQKIALAIEQLQNVVSVK